MKILIAFLLMLFTVGKVYPQSFQWANTYWSNANGQEGIVPAGMHLDRAGNVIVGGSFVGTVDFDAGPEVTPRSSAGGGTRSGFIAKYDSKGNYVWVKTFDGTNTNSVCNIYSIAVDADDNIYIVGELYGTIDFDSDTFMGDMVSTGEGDMFVAKYDRDGKYIWSFTLGSEGFDRALDVAVDKSTGAVFVTGVFSSTVDFDPGADSANLSVSGKKYRTNLFVAKFTSTGKYVFAHSINSSSLEANIVVHEGRVFITSVFSGTVDFNPSSGEMATLHADGNALFFAGYDGVGKYLFARAIDNADISASIFRGGRALAVDGAGNLYLAGVFSIQADFDAGPETFILTTTASTAMFFAKYDSRGVFIFARKIDIDGSTVSCVSVDPSGAMYLTGYFYQSGDFNPGAGSAVLNATSENGFAGFNMFLAKYDAVGNYVTAQNFGAYLQDFCTDMVVDGAGNAYLYGLFLSDSCDFNPGNGGSARKKGSPPGTTFDVFLAKYHTSPLSITENIIVDEPYVYPNPTSGTITLQLPDAPSHIEVSNVLGERFAVSADNSSNPVIDISWLGRGLYFISARVQNGIYNTKFIRE